jgi:uncharacterized protein with von Willebrand factor type A (vWA) domain
MAIHHYRYSMWDGRQDVPDFTADELLEHMADDLLRGGDPERALRDLLRRGFSLPDGRRFEGLQRLLRRMEQYRRDTFARYDPSGVVDRVREQLEEIVGMERDEIDMRRRPDEKSDGSSSEPSAGQESPEGSVPQAGDERRQDRSGSQTAGSESSAAKGEASAGDDSESSGADTQGGASGQGASAGDAGEFGRMLERMLQRKESYLDQLPQDNAGRIRGLREYDFLSSEAREAFERLVGGMQRRLMEQYFQGMKQGLGQITPDQMDAMRQMVRDLNEMLEASQAGDRGAFDRFMEQHGENFPPGINSLEELLEHLQRQSAAIQSLLENMDPEQRAELEAMMEELLRDDRLRMDLARLGANLSRMGFTPDPSSFPFRGGDAPGFGQSLDMMSRLQAMQDLENAIRSGDPFNAISQAGGNSPGDLFGPGLGGQIEAVKDMADALLNAGYLRRDGERLSLTSRAVRKLGDAALREVFRRMKDDRAGGHVTARKGTGGDITLESRPYQFGDPFHVDIKSTVMNGVCREGVGTPVHIAADDFAIFETERAVQHATVLCLDMSYSMYLSDLFLEAKKTALALDSLIRGQFPRDALYLVGFADSAFELAPEQLPALAENDYVQGTNYEMALSLARRLLARHRGGNRQILFVTDGEPTIWNAPNGRSYFVWPPDQTVLGAVLLEAARCAKEGITINTFCLDDKPRFVRFCEELTAINHGRLFLTGPYHPLSERVVLDYLQGRTVRHLH